MSNGINFQIYELMNLRLAVAILLKSEIKAMEWAPSVDKLIATAHNTNVSFCYINIIIKCFVFTIFLCFNYS